MTPAELDRDDAADTRADLAEREQAWLEPDRRPEPDRAAELAELADLRAVMDGGLEGSCGLRGPAACAQCEFRAHCENPWSELVCECGDCGQVYAYRAHHECAQMRRRNGARGSSRTCPSCKRPGVLTAREAARGYQCRACTRRDEGYGFEG